MTDVSAAPPAKPGAEDLFEIFYAPSKVFERRRGGEYGLPLVVLVVMAAVIFFATKGLMDPIMDAERAMQLAKTTAKMTPEQAEQVRAASSGALAGTITMISIPLAFLISPFVLGFIAWLVAKVAGVTVRYGIAVMIAVFAWYPRLVEMVVNAAQMALLPNIQPTSRLAVSLGVGRFLDGAHPNLATAVLSRVDLFTLWVTFLIGLGFMVAGKATKAQAIAIAVVVWVIGMLPALWAAMR
jgi:hypothetical protein